MAFTFSVETVVWGYVFSSTSVTLTFADNIAEDSILPLKDPLGLDNSSFSLTGQKYFKIDIMPKTMAKLTHVYTIFSH